MNKLETANKRFIASQLRAFAEGPNLTHAIAAIEGLGELGGPLALEHIDQLLEKHQGPKTDSEREKWNALLRAYGRAGRMLPE